MSINDFLQKYRRVDFGMNVIRPRVKCADGYTVSVQAGYGSYSFPREDADFYEKVELGYPSEMDVEFEPYFDGSICAFVPVTVVDAVLKNHGGIVGADLSNDMMKVWRDVDSDAETD